MDERLLEKFDHPAYTCHWRRWFITHAAWVAEMDAILAIAARHGVAVVEDNAHGLFGRYKVRMLGTFGCMATQSFHETKNIHCGEGGALLINDPSLIERAEILREKGTNRSAFFRGQVDKYTWVDVGSSYVISDCLAAFFVCPVGAPRGDYHRGSRTNLASLRARPLRIAPETMESACPTCRRTVSSRFTCSIC